MNCTKVFLLVCTTFSKFLAKTCKLIILHPLDLYFDKLVSAPNFSPSEQSENQTHKILVILTFKEPYLVSCNGIFVITKTVLIKPVSDLSTVDTYSLFWILLIIFNIYTQHQGQTNFQTKTHCNKFIRQDICSADNFYNNCIFETISFDKRHKTIPQQFIYPIIYFALVNVTDVNKKTSNQTS